MSSIDWETLVRNADDKIDEVPYVYEFGGRRKFYDSGPKSGVYATNFLQDSEGRIIMDSDGDWIRTRV
jgi:hypothetical protein